MTTVTTSSIWSNRPKRYARYARVGVAVPSVSTQKEVHSLHLDSSTAQCILPVSLSLYPSHSSKIEILRVCSFWSSLLLKKKKVMWSRYRPGVSHRVGRGIALLFHDRGTRRGWVVSSTPRPHFTPGKDPVPILQGTGWAPGPVWTGGKSRPHRDSIPDHPARSSVATPTELPGPHYWETET